MLSTLSPGARPGHGPSAESLPRRHIGSQTEAAVSGTAPLVTMDPADSETAGRGNPCLGVDQEWTSVVAVWSPREPTTSHGEPSYDLARRLAVVSYVCCADAPGDSSTALFFFHRCRESGETLSFCRPSRKSLSRCRQAAKAEKTRRRAHEYIRILYIDYSPFAQDTDTVCRARGPSAKEERRA